MNQRKMVKNWYDEAKKHLAPEEKIEKSYPCIKDGKYGYLLLTECRLMFLHVKGFLNKKYQRMLNLYWNEVKEISHLNKYKLSIKDNKGNKHIFTSEIFADIVEASLNYFYQSYQMEPLQEPEVHAQQLT